MQTAPLPVVYKRSTHHNQVFHHLHCYIKGKNYHCVSDHYAPLHTVQAQLLLFFFLHQITLSLLSKRRFQVPIFCYLQLYLATYHIQPIHDYWKKNTLAHILVSLPLHPVPYLVLLHLSSQQVCKTLFLLLLLDF